MSYRWASMAFDTRARGALALAADFLTGQGTVAPADVLTMLDADGADASSIAAEMVAAGWHTLTESETGAAVELDAPELETAAAAILARWRAEEGAHDAGT